MDVAPTPACHGGRARRRRHLAMLVRRLRNPLIWSPLAALVAQLLLAATVSAATGGGDFPRF
jgi:hypothetical protein